MQLKKEPKRGKKRGFFSRKKDEEASIEVSAVEATDEVVAGAGAGTDAEVGVEACDTPSEESQAEHAEFTQPGDATESGAFVDQTDHGQDGDQPWSEVTAHLPGEMEDNMDREEESEDGLSDTSLFSEGASVSDETEASSAVSESEEEDSAQELAGDEEGTALPDAAAEDPSQEGERDEESFDTTGDSSEDDTDGADSDTAEGDEETQSVSDSPELDTGADDSAFVMMGAPVLADAGGATGQGWVRDTTCCSPTEAPADAEADAELGTTGDAQDTGTELAEDDVAEETDVNPTDVGEDEASARTEDGGADEEEGNPFAEDGSGDEQEGPRILLENRPPDVYPALSVPEGEELDCAVIDEMHLAQEEVGDADPADFYQHIANVAHTLPVTLLSAEEQACPICGEVHKIIALSYQTQLNKGGVPVSFASVHDYCTRCEVIFTTEKRAFQNYTAMCDAYKHDCGLLTGGEISAVLDKYGMTPENFDVIFDWDAGTTSSFIAGDTQNMIHDGVIRKAGNDPLWFYGILLPCNNELPSEEFSRIEETAREICEEADPDGLQELLKSREGSSSAISGKLDASDDSAEEETEEEEEVIDTGAEDSASAAEQESEDGGSDTTGKEVESISEAKPTTKPKKEHRPILGFLRKKRKETAEQEDTGDPFTETEAEPQSLPQIDLGDPEAAAGALNQYDENGVIQPKEVKHSRDEYHPVSHTSEEDEDTTQPTAPLEGQDSGDEDLPSDPEDEEDDSEDIETEDGEDEEEPSKRGRRGRKKDRPKKESRRERRKRERAEAALMEEEEEDDAEVEDEDEDEEGDDMSGEDYGEEEYETSKDSAKDVLFFLVEIVIGAAVTALIGYQVGSVYLQNLVSTYLGG